ncbi:MAG TPA: APC family permease [Candidatus Acidoferrales bacterium]|jgi:amino acid transporter|nr:APC family permease [Candidatus Acidoferrales bacterium]
MSVLDILIGKPLANWDERAEQIGAAAGIPIFGLDALSSAAYGPEAALTLLIPLGAAGVAYIVPISASIIVLLAIVYFSYRQTIAAYPGGGGSYTVATENLGTYPGLLAAAALMIDYILVVAVGISAGVGALVSAAPKLQPHTLLICLSILLVIMIVNLRGLREAGIFFMVPTYLFVGSLLIAIAMGLFKTVHAAGHPMPAVALPPHPAPVLAAASTWILLQTFANGCTAMTGVEAVSNGVRAFRDPTVKNAQKTLTVIIGVLIVMLAGIAYLVRAYQITATDPGKPGYQSVLSMLVAAVVGRNWFYYVTVGSVLVILSLSANTAFADFPRLCKMVAQNDFLPHSFGFRGRRLVYSQGIIVLFVLAAILLTVFGGVTDRLIPLFAIGAFLAFTLSQAGMVGHWWRKRGRGYVGNMLMNGLGALATGATLLVVLVAKFTSGAWVSALLIVAMMMLMLWVRRHYREVAVETCSTSPLDVDSLGPPIVVVPIQDWGKVAQRALEFGLTLSTDIRALHVATETETNALRAQWPQVVGQPLEKAGRTPPELVTLTSPYRLVLRPILDYILEVEKDNPGRQIAVIVPELVERHWYHYPLHNQRAELLKALILLHGSQRIVLINVPWYIST